MRISLILSPGMDPRPGKGEPEEKGSVQISSPRHGGSCVSEKSHDEANLCTNTGHRSLSELMMHNMENSELS